VRLYSDGALKEALMSSTTPKDRYALAQEVQPPAEQDAPTVDRDGRLVRTPIEGVR
jgi:hypothetical protein